MSASSVASSPPAASADSLIRLPEVMRRTGLSKSGVYQLIREGKFPAPLPLYGARCRAWAESEVSAWIAERIRLARAGRRS